MYDAPIAARIVSQPGVSPGTNSLAAWSNARRVRSKQRRTTARKSSFFVPNSWNTYGWETPARAATPRSRRRRGRRSRIPGTPAATIASRRSSAVIRVGRVVVVVMGGN